MSRTGESGISVDASHVFHHEDGGVGDQLDLYRYDHGDFLVVLTTAGEGASFTIPAERAAELGAALTSPTGSG